MESHPNDVPIEWSVDKRPGKVFFDFNMNARGKTLASIYSPRAVDGAPVSFPVDWKDLDSVYPAQFDIDSVADGVEQRGDAWSAVFEIRMDVLRVLSLSDPGAPRA